MQESLANKYRPKTFDEVIGQEVVVKILKQQLLTNNVKNCYLFIGKSGSGKTTCARILASEVNKGFGEPIEIDGASNNGVDNVRAIIDNANKRSLDSTYKVFIVDECQAITIQGWQAFLKTIEEPPLYTIFIFCTTNVEKVPETIQNRCQKFVFNKVDKQVLKEYLIKVCNKENLKGEIEQVCSYISSISDGSVRTALATLDKVIAFNDNLTLVNATKVLGTATNKTFFTITNKIIDKDNSLLDDLERVSNEPKIFIDQYINFVLDLVKYCLSKSLKNTMFVDDDLEELEYTTEKGTQGKYFIKFVNKLLDIKNTIRNDTNAKSTIEVMLLSLCA